MNYIQKLKIFLLLHHPIWQEKQDKLKASDMRLDADGLKTAPAGKM
jgi:hypothetical protein